MGRPTTRTSLYQGSMHETAPPAFCPFRRLAALPSGCVSELDSGAYGSMDDPRNAQMLDLVDQALKGNMAVVLVADVMPHKSLSDA